MIGPDGQVEARYDKIHMFDVQLGSGNIYRESDSYAPGGQAVIAKLPKAVVGMTVCYDVRFPDLFRELAWAGSQVIAVPAAFTKITGEAHWHVLLRARAIETGCFVIAPAQGGKHTDGRETFGHSLIIDPWGEVLAEGGVEPGVVMATLDLSKVDEVRKKVPSLQHVREFRRV
jgi:predicted amidohydrolase